METAHWRGWTFERRSSGEIMVSHPDYGREVVEVLDSESIAASLLYKLAAEMIHDNPEGSLNAYVRSIDSLHGCTRDLYDTLQEFAVQYNCGCGHPACNNCERDRMAKRALDQIPASVRDMPR